MIIGIIGKAGVGKSTLIKNLQLNFDCMTIIVDIFVHHLILQDKFYQDLLIYLTGSLDRNEMRKVLFNDLEKMKLIESYVGNKLKDKINKVKDLVEIVIVESANLDKFPISPDIFIEVVCLEQTRLDRLILRDGEKKAKDLIEFQKNLNYNHIENKLIFNSELDSLDPLIGKINENLQRSNIS